MVPDKLIKESRVFVLLVKKGKILKVKKYKSLAVYKLKSFQRYPTSSTIGIKPVKARVYVGGGPKSTPLKYVGGGSKFNQLNCA